jgi:hypothetical protein
MRAFEAANPGRDAIDAAGNGYHVEPRRAIALSPVTSEQYSASSRDYWQLADDEPLTDAVGEPMVLVVPFSGYRDALTGEAL